MYLFFQLPDVFYRFTFLAREISISYQHLIVFLKTFHAIKSDANIGFFSVNNLLVLNKCLLLKRLCISNLISIYLR